MRIYFILVFLGLFSCKSHNAVLIYQFDKGTIRTNDRPLRIITNGRTSKNLFIQKVNRNEEEISSSIIDFNLISKGDIFQFELTDTPNKAWGKQN